MRGQQGLGAALQVHEEQVVVAAADQTADHREPPVTADVGDGVEARARAHGPGLAGSRVEQEGVHLGGMETIGGDAEPATVAAPAVAAVVHLAAGGDHLRARAVGPGHIDLDVQAAPGRHGIGQPVGLRRPDDALHRVLQSGHLDRRAAAERRHPHLRRTAGVGDVGDPGPVRRKAARACRADRGDGRDPVCRRGLGLGRRPGQKRGDRRQNRLPSTHGKSPR